MNSTSNSLFRERDAQSSGRRFTSRHVRVRAFPRSNRIQPTANIANCFAPMVKKLKRVEIAYLAAFHRLTSNVLLLLKNNVYNLAFNGWQIQGESKMLWARMVTYVTGMVDQELLLRNEYLGAENRILRDQIKGRLLLQKVKRRHWRRSPSGSEGKPWKNWRRSRSRIRCWPGTESSSPTNSTDRSFANESVDREFMRKQNGLSGRWRKKIPRGATTAHLWPCQ